MTAFKDLSKEEVRLLLRECVTVVRPGEILVIQVSENFSPNQLREYQDSVTGWLTTYAPGIQALVITGEGRQVIQPESMTGPLAPFLPMPSDPPWSNGMQHMGTTCSICGRADCAPNNPRHDPGPIR